MTTGGFPCGGKSPAYDNSCFPRARPEIVSRPRPWPEIIPPSVPFPAVRRLYKQALQAAMSTHQNLSQGESSTQDPP
jgi:hypothetical protein